MRDLNWGFILALLFILLFWVGVGLLVKGCVS